MDCSNVQIKYKGNGVQVLYTFPFEYMDETDIWIGLWNDNSHRWEEIHDWLDLNQQPDIIAPYYWTFDNATTIRFLRNPGNADGSAAPVPPPVDWAPPGPNNPTSEPTGANLIIQRRSSDNELVEFYPGSSIRAQDLNYNFEQLEYLIQEGRCIISDEILNYLRNVYWNKFEETTYSTDDWNSEADDEHIPTTGAVDKWVTEQFVEQDALRASRVTRDEQINGNATIDDEHVFTTAASAARHDVYTQANTPAAVPVEQPGKLWFQTDVLDSVIWDANAGAWVDMGNAGPAGPAGPPGSFIVSDAPPTSFPDPNSPGGSRALQQGDGWFNSDTGELFVWYIDLNSGQWVNISKAGPPGQDGQGGGGGIPEAPTDGRQYGRQSSSWTVIAPTGADFVNLTGTAPMVVTRSNANQNADISIDLTLLNGTP
jgi:hypothetical protein